MLRNIFPKIFLCFLMCNFLFFSTPILSFAQDIPPTANTQQLATPEANQANAPVTEPTGCNPFSWRSFSLTSCIGSIINWIFVKIFEFINFLLSYVLWVASLVLDFTIYFTVVKFKTNFSDLSLGGAGSFVLGDNGSSLIYYLWGMVRDFLNIIIFISIIYAAVYSMFEGFENTRRKFITLLVFSIIANFSLLFVKIAIDISNILALQAYTLVVKPQGTSSFSQFRTSSVSGGVSSYGEYIMNSVDLEKLSSEKTGSKAATEGAKNIKNTVIFQIGKMITIIGVIYVLLFIAGFLVMRAGVLLYAMIISPLIALDVFFKMWNTGTGDEIENLAKGVRNVTSKVLGDFYDALLKGPLIIFFIFLIGVFAEAILSKGIQDTLTQSLGQMKDVQKNGNVFTDNLFVFFKFAIFLTLCQILFNKINEFSFGKDQGKFIRRWAGRGANFAFGRGAGVLGFAGRNVVGRGLNRSGLVNTFAKWNQNATKNVNDRSRGFVNRQLNRGVQLGTNIGQRIGGGLMGASYDARNLTLPDTQIVKDFKTAVDFDSRDLGAPVTTGFRGVDEARKKAREDAEEKNVAITAGNLKISEKQVLDALNDSTVTTKIGDVDTKFSDMIKYLKGFDEKTAEQQKAFMEGGGNIGGRAFTADQAKKLFDKNNPGSIDDVLTKAKKSEEERMTKDAKKKYEKSRELQMALKESRTLGDTLNIADRLTSATMSTMERDAFIRAREKAGAKAKEDGKENAQRFFVITNEKRDLEAALSEVNKALKLGDVLTTPQKDDLKKLKDKIETNISTLGLPAGKVEDSDKEKIIKTFKENKDLQSDVIKIRSSVSDTLTNIFAKGESTKAFYDTIKAEKNSLDDELKALELTKPNIKGKSPDRAKATMRAYATNMREVRERKESLEDILKNGFKNAMDIGEKAQKAETAIKENFEPKKVEAKEEKK